MTHQTETPGCAGTQSGAKQTVVGAESTESIVLRSPNQEGRFPPPDTCAGQLLAELLRGCEVTHRTIDGEANTMCTAVNVARLRRRGWPIVTEMRASRNQFEAMRFGVYRIDEDVEIGEREQAHIDACLKVRGSLI